MQQLQQIKAAYDWFYSHWQQEAIKAISANNTAELDRLEEKRDTLERGVFVLMFGQFERVVDQRFIAARSTRETNPDWTIRRGWDSDALKSRKVPFETRLSLVIDKRSNLYGKILDAYGIRNHCAHGGTTTPVGSIDSFETDLYNWASALRG